MYYALHITVHVLGEHAPHTYCVAKGGVASGGFLPLRHAKLPTMVAWVVNAP